LFVSLVTYRSPLTPEDPLYADHRTFVQERTADSSILCAGPRTGVDGGLIIVYGDDEAEARALLDSDPFVVAGHATYELHQFKVGLADPRSSLA
jgi:uncharacterized protein YciI